MRSLIHSLIVLVFTFSNCAKSGPDHKVYFYSTQPLDYSVTKLELYIHDSYKGDIPYVKDRLWFGDDSLETKALILNLGPDKYSILAKDQLGNSKSEGEMKLKRKSVSVTSLIGTLHSRMQDGDVIIEITRN